MGSTSKTQDTESPGEKQKQSNRETFKQECVLGDDSMRRSNKELLKSCIKESSTTDASPTTEMTRISNKELLKAFIGSRPPPSKRHHSSSQKIKSPRPIREEKKKKALVEKVAVKHSEKEPLIPQESTKQQERRVTFSSSVKSATCLIGTRIPKQTTNDEDSASSEESMAESEDLQTIDYQHYPGLADSTLFHALGSWVNLEENESFDAYTYASSHSVF